MAEQNKLLNLKEVSRILSINTEVLRRWLRSGRLKGVKVGSDWRVNSKDLAPFINVQEIQTETKSENSSPMCFRFPKWLEFSGLPAQINNKIGPEAWPVLKKLIELDFEQGKPADRKIIFDISEFVERVGYSQPKIEFILTQLVEAEYIRFSEKNGQIAVIVITPIKTPRLILDISYEKGGIKGAPGHALTNGCLRRFLESE